MIVNPLNNNKQIIIANKINEARYKMSKAEQKLFLYCVGHIDNREDKLDDELVISVPDFANFMGVQANHHYSNLKTMTRDFLGRSLEFYDEKPGKLRQIAILSRVDYDLKHSTIHIKVNPDLKPYLIDLKNQFTQYSLQEVIQFKSLYSMRLYQILNQWEYNHQITYSIERLRFMLNVQDGEYKLYGDFKRKILEVARKEINTESSLKYTYKEHKTGRKITDITFFIEKISKSKQETIDQPIKEPPRVAKIEIEVKVEKLPKINFVMIESQEGNQGLKRLASIGLSRSSSQKLLDEYGENYIVFALEKSKIESRTNVENKAGYFSSLAGNYVETYENQKQSQQNEKEQVGINEEIREQKAKRLEERQNKFRQEQEGLAKEILEYEPVIFCKTIYSYLDIFISINWGYSNHPDWHSNKRAGKSEENIKIAKEIRSEFRACTSFRDFKNLIRENENWIFQAVFNEIEQFDEGSDEYYKANNNLKRLDKIELPFKI